VAILHERGLFWWHDEPIPEHQFAPNSCVPGLLTIREDGRVTLELDACLPSPHGPLAAMSNGPEDRWIQGILKESDKRVLVLNLLRSGGRFSSNAMSFERFVAMDCLVGETAFPIAKKKLQCRALQVGLDGLQEWLRLGSLRVSRSASHLSVKYKKPKDRWYPLESGKLGIKFHLSGPYKGKHRTENLTVKETASIELHLKNKLSLDDNSLKARFALVEDLFIVLTGSEYTLEWPFVMLSKNAKFRWYFRRVRDRGNDEAPKWHECWTNFLQLQESFGTIWSHWEKKRSTFGAGFYLYLGTRRGMKLYAEHRFVNLIWGIEAFHRQGTPTSLSIALVTCSPKIPPSDS
jgi:hypothetical protein